MSKDFSKKFIKYIKKVYHIEDALKVFKDGMKNPLYTTAGPALPVLLGFVIRMQSFNALKYKIKSNDFINAL